MSIRLRLDAFATLAASQGHLTYEQQANATGLGVGTIHRIRSGGAASSSSVAAICSTYGVEFADLFVITTVRRSARAAAAA